MLVYVLTVPIVGCVYSKASPLFILRVAHLSTSSNGFHRPAVQGDELQSGGQDSSLKLLLCFILFTVLPTLVLITLHRHENNDVPA